MNNETWSIDRVLCEGNFHGKICWKCALKTSSRPLFDFDK